jgi:hypothetical protein
VVYIANRSNIQDLQILEGNVLNQLEKEIAVGVKPTEFAQRAGKSISAARAREILREMGFHPPSQIRNESVLNEDVLNAPSLSKEQIDEFYRRANR